MCNHGNLNPDVLRGWQELQGRAVGFFQGNIDPEFVGRAVNLAKGNFNPDFVQGLQVARSDFNQGLQVIEQGRTLEVLSYTLSQPPGVYETLIPFWGAARQAYDGYQRGDAEGLINNSLLALGEYLWLRSMLSPEGPKQGSPQAPTSSGETPCPTALKTRPQQIHHFATNKSKTYTPKMKAIADKYGLDLDAAWNKELMPHLGRHPNDYHEFVLRGMEQAAREAGGDTARFLEGFEKYVKEPVRNNPDLLRKAGWR